MRGRRCCTRRLGPGHMAKKDRGCGGAPLVDEKQVSHAACARHYRAPPRAPPAAARVAGLSLRWKATEETTALRLG